MRRRYTLDTGVLALYFAGSSEAKKYIDMIYEGRAEAFMCEINVAEFLYNYARVFGWDAALARHSLLRSSPINIVGVDESLTIEAAKLKLRHYNKLSLVDCYLIALAKLKRATIITTDRSIERVGEASVVLLSVS